VKIEILVLSIEKKMKKQDIELSICQNKLTENILKFKKVIYRFFAG
jgi:hypothetical protein